MHIVDCLDKTVSQRSGNKSVKWCDHRAKTKTEWNENWKQDVEKKNWRNRRVIKGIIIAIIAVSDYLFNYS